jgi:Lamin Tail Domain
MRAWLVPSAAFGAAALAAALLSGCGPSVPGADGCKAGLLPGDLVITEVFADFKAATGGSGVDTGKEWFELYNASGHPIELAGLTITHSRPDGARASAHTMTGGMIGAGELFTLGNAAQELIPPYVDYGYAADLADLFNTGGGKLALACDGDEVDSAIYDVVKEGHARALSAGSVPEYTVNDTQDSWCEANDSEFEAGNFGTPGGANDCRPIVAGQCSDGGAMRPAVAPAIGDLVITELMPSPEVAGDDTGEWFEARVMADVDLNGVGLDRVSDARRPDVIRGTACVRVTAGTHVVFARSALTGSNGGIAAASIAGTFGFTMVGGTAGSPGDVAIVAGTAVIDAVRWTRSSNGKALQLDPDLVDPSANDTESNFCDAAAPYGLPPLPAVPDLGTPGVANTQCTLLPGPGMCDDGGTFRPIVKPAPGALVISEVLANPANIVVEEVASVDAQREWFEVANIGPAAFDLNELAMGRIGSDGKAVQSAACISVAAGGFAVLARSGDQGNNGMLPAVAATFSFGLVDNSGDIRISDGATMLDEVRWVSVTSGVSRQVAPARLTTAGNDDPASYCAGAAPYGDMSNKGTPGTANACP